jgi:hypothetical protein
MKVLRQEVDEIAASLTEMEAEWMDGTAANVISALAKLPFRETYTRADLDALLQEDFGTAITIFQLLLDISKDELRQRLPHALGGGGSGVTRYRMDPGAFLDALERLGVDVAMTEAVHRKTVWSDILVERLKSGRGRAIRGQARGRSLEDFVQERIERVFGAESFDRGCSFVGRDGEQRAKADFAIPSKENPRIVIEVKAYAATGSKQTDVLGDLAAIIRTKRHDTTLLFVTDGLTWRDRLSDLRKIVELQNRGEITRIYTRALAEEMEEDLHVLRQEHGIS